jgi:hypothetical protein
MAAQITAVLAQFTEVLGAIVTGIADIAGFLVSNPLTVIAIMMTLVGFGFRIVRSYLHN